MPDCSLCAPEHVAENRLLLPKIDSAGHQNVQGRLRICSCEPGVTYVDLKLPHTCQECIFVNRCVGRPPERGSTAPPGHAQHKNPFGTFNEKSCSDQVLEYV